MIDEADFRADRMMDELSSTLLCYQKINGRDFVNKGSSEQRLAYEGLYGSLWRFYKDRMQKYLSAFGWDLALLFCKEKNFNKEKTKFLLKYQGHESLVELIEKIREDRQNDFADLRNRYEHDGDFRNHDDMCNPQVAKVNLI